MNLLKKLKLNGVLYSIGQSLDNTMKVAPTLDKAPNFTTSSYIKDGQTINFVIGDLCRVTNEESESGYYFYRLHDINSEGRYIWSRLDTGILDESAIVTVKVTSNQDTTEDLINKVKINLHCEDENEDIIYTGEDIYFVIPNGVEYNISFDTNDSKYLAPPEIIETTTVNSRPLHLVEFKVEKVTVNVSASDGSNMDDVVVTVNGESKTEDLTWTIPFNTVYLIEVPTKEGYTPIISLNNITANLKNREINVVYYETEIVNVTVSSNLPSYLEDLNGVQITVNGETKTWNGYTLTFNVPHGTKYTISASNLADYKLTNNNSGQKIAQGGNIINATITYETEVISVISNLHNIDVLCNGVSKSYTGTAVIFKVAYDTVYDIAGSVVSEYLVATQSFVASQVNREVILTYTETVVTFTVNVTSSQPSTTDISNAKITINGTAYSDGDAVKLNKGILYTASATNITGYRVTLSSTEGIASANTIITAVYESEFVLLSSNKTGVTLICNESNYTYNGTTIIAKIPYGTSYKATGTIQSGYSVTSDSFIASQASRSLNIIYQESKAGIYGLMADGSETDTITNSCVGIICRDVDNSIEFIVGKTYKVDIPWSTNNYGSSIVSGLKIMNDFYNGELDSYRAVIKQRYLDGYTGPFNTSKIQVLDSIESNNAALYCSNLTITVADKTLQGYLGCALEFLFIYDNWERFRNALKALGNTVDLEDMYIWMAEFYSSNNGWILSLRNSSSNLPYFYTYCKDYSHGSSCVLPFFRLDRTV